MPKVIATDLLGVTLHMSVYNSMIAAGKAEKCLREKQRFKFMNKLAYCSSK